MNATGRKLMLNEFGWDFYEDRLSRYFKNRKRSKKNGDKEYSRNLRHRLKVQTKKIIDKDLIGE